MTEEAVPVITIDGPGGSGKGTIGARLANELGWEFLDSGALYRLVGLAASKHDVSLDNEEALEKIARELDAQFAVKRVGEEILHYTYLEDEDVGAELRTEAAGAAASKVAVLQKVRAALLQRQRDFRISPGLVCDGRDMGTTVFPDAELKIYLTASAEERAKRRAKQLKNKGLGANLAQILADIKARDERDMNRSASPLVPADDAVVVDTTEMGVIEVEERIRDLVKSRFNL
ncbi:MAG: (d)CMP kinase [Gammaproteobacteria bacterium]|nr:(d)CMP kinase [Gammaproteobacteria bacterium]